MSKTFFNGKGKVAGYGLVLTRYCGYEDLLKTEKTRVSLMMTINEAGCDKFLPICLSYSEVEQLSKQLERFLNDAVLNPASRFLYTLEMIVVRK